MPAPAQSVIVVAALAEIKCSSYVLVYGLTQPAKTPKWNGWSLKMRVKEHAVQTGGPGTRPHRRGGAVEKPAAMVLGALEEQKIKLFCWCNRCGRNLELPALPLIRQLGPNYPVPEVGARMRCTECGSKDIATRPAWPGRGQVTRHGPG